MKPRNSVFLVLFACVIGGFAQVYKAAPNGGNENHNTVEVVASVEPETVKNDLITQTVYGFLDFTTTIGNTLMVFRPQSAPAEGEKEKEKTTTTASPIETKPIVAKKNADIQPSKTHKSEQQDETKKSGKNTKIVVNSIVQQSDQPKKTESQKIQPEASKGPVVSSVVLVHSQGETPVKNNLAEPEYDYLSKQPTEIVDETYKLINLRPSSKVPAKPRPSPKKEKENPTGLVTRLGGTVVKDGLTTVHDTSVIGTYINGKYAQVLQSSSSILKSGSPVVPEGKIRPTNAQRILKTIGPQHGKLKPQLEPTPAQQPEDSSLPLEGLFNSPSEDPLVAGPSVKTTRRHTANHPVRPKFRNKITDDPENYDGSQQTRIPAKNRPAAARPSYKNRVPTTTTETPATRRRTGFRPSNNQQLSSPPKPSRAKFEQNSPLSGIPKVKLPRTQGRWSYKTTPKPRIAIRKQNDDEERVSTTETPVTSDAVLTTITEDKSSTSLSSSPAQKKIQDGVTVDEELDSSETEEVSQTSVQNDQAPEQILPVETINVEISTPAEFNDIYFEIATIKSPYAFQVGTLKNTRYITVTSTTKKSFATAEPSTLTAPTEPLTENILANTGAAYESSLPLDSSVATLPAITLESGQATPPLETLTETFSTTQTLLKTHLLPVVSNGNTTRITLVQTYNIARMVTATKTLPPSELFQFIPSKTLNEFNTKLDEAGSELHLELDFGDDDRDDEDIPKRIVVPNSEGDSDLEHFRASQKPKEVSTPSPEPQLTPEQAQQLALFKYFGQQQQQQQQPQVITTSRPVIVLETVYESHVIPLVNNGNTVYSTLSRPVATIPRTSYEYGTSTLAPILPPQVPQMPQVPIFPQQQPQYTITSAPIVTQALATISDSRILKLTFGAKTAYTTLFSTRVVPTEVTTYVITTVPVQPTVPAYPGYFPQPVGYPPYPYVG